MYIAGPRIGIPRRNDRHRDGYHHNLAIRSGIDIPSFLGSLSIFTLGKLGSHNRRKLWNGAILGWELGQARAGRRVRFQAITTEITVEA